MDALIIARIVLLLLATAGFFFLAKRLKGIMTSALVLLGVGFALIMLDLILRPYLQGQVVFHAFASRVAPPVRFLVTYFGQIAGLLLLLAGFYRVNRVLVDITERQRFEDQNRIITQALAESEKRYRRFFEEDLSGNFIATPAGKLLACNPAFVRIFGFASVEEALATEAFHFFEDPNERERSMALLKQQRRLVGIRRLMRKRDGTPIHVVANIIGEFDDQDDLIAVQGYVLDESDRIRAEEAIRESERRYRALVENGADMVSLVSPAGKILYSGPSTTRILGYTAEEFIGLDAFALVHPDDLPATGKLFAELLDRPRGSTVKVEFRFRHKNGEWRWVEAIGKNLLDDPSIGGIVINYRDVTERKLAERALTESEEKYRKLIESANDAIIIADAQTGIIVDLNRKAEELAGIPADQLKGRHHTCMHPPEGASMYEDVFRRAAATGGVTTGELFILHRSGRRIPVEISASVLSLGGRTVVQGIYRDLTERKNLEERLLQSQKLESVGRLAGGIAHDFNNILAIVLGYISSLEQPSGDPEKHAQKVAAIKKGVERGAGLVRQLLTFARKTTGVSQNVDLNEMIRELAQLLAETFPPTIRLELHLEEGLPPVLVDPDQLQQALLNLCVNARDAMEDAAPEGTGHLLEIRTAVIDGAELRQRFSEAPDQQHVLVSVADTGVGIDAETKTRIFEPFFTTKGLGKGTGLGLAVVYGVVNAHRGFIDVESIPGKGTTMRMYFPAQMAAAVRPRLEKESASSPAGRGETILVVEDEEMLLDLLRTLLEEHGYRVLTARDGVEAVEVYAEHRGEIRAVLSDMGLPRLGGWEAFQRMREMDPDVRAILASGYFDPALRSDMIRAGAKDFVQKPYVPSLIVKRIREVIDDGGSRSAPTDDPAFVGW